MRSLLVVSAISALSLAVVTVVIFTTVIARGACRALQEAGRPAADGGPVIDVVFGSGGPDLRPLVVAARSAMASSRDPRRLRFHSFATEAEAPGREEQLRMSLPDASVHVHANTAALQRLQRLLTGRNRALCSPFALAPFFFEHFLSDSEMDIRRIVALHADVVVQGDLLALAEVDLGGRASGAVAQCDQPRLRDLVGAEALRELGPRPGIDPGACDAGHGMVVIDPAAWVRQGVEARIEALLATARVSPRKVWLTRGSHLPWLLATAAGSAFFDLSAAWPICDGLGNWTKEPPPSEACSASAKLLHFSGAAKPWFGTPPHLAPALCAVPGEGDAVLCQALWSQYISELALAGEDEAKGGGPEIHAMEEAPAVTTNTAATPPSPHSAAVAPPSAVAVARPGAPAPAPAPAPPSSAQTQVAAPRTKAKTTSKDAKPTTVGGYQYGQAVRAAWDISSKGRVIVRKGVHGTVIQPSRNQPANRVNVRFAERVDGSLRAVNVLPQEIQPL